MSRDSCRKLTNYEVIWGEVNIGASARVKQSALNNASGPKPVQGLSETRRLSKEDILPRARAETLIFLWLCPLN